MKYVVLIAFSVFFYYEFIRDEGSGTVANVPSNANALGLPTAGIAPSTLTPAQLGTGLFENEAGLGSQQPDVTTQSY